MFWHPWRTESPSLSMGMIQGGEEMYDWGMMGMSGAHQLKRNAVVNQFSENTWARQREEEGQWGSAGPASDKSSDFEKNPVINLDRVS